MKFETLYLKGNRCHDELINRVTDIIDILSNAKTHQNTILLAPVVNLLLL